MTGSVDFDFHTRTFTIWTLTGGVPKGIFSIDSQSANGRAAPIDPDRRASSGMSEFLHPVAPAGRGHRLSDS
jgi:hypothetical protein